MDDMLDLAIADPDEALRWSDLVLSARPTSLERSYALQVRGIVLRERGEVAGALRSLRAGLRAAVSHGESDRVRDVRATLGSTLVVAGRGDEGIREIQAAAVGAHGELGGKILMRLAGALSILGRYEESLPVLDTALREMEAAGNRVWEARTRLWMGNSLLALGRVEDARFQVERASSMQREEGADVGYLDALHNLAEISTARGDVPGALRLTRRAVDAAAALGAMPRFDAADLHAKALLQAGMPGEAVAHLRQFADEARLAPHEGAELRLALADALLADDDGPAALVEARRARHEYRRQGREWHELRARLVAVRAWAAGGAPATARLAEEAALVATALDQARSHEAPGALIVAGMVHRDHARQRFWERAGSYVGHPNALVRAAAWQARTLQDGENDARGGVLRAAAAGLDAIDEHRRLIGSSELRALATTHGRELTEIALRHAATDPRSLLRWSERTRATALAQSPATSDVATIPASLAALRANGRRLAEARQEGDPTEELERARLRLERAVRAESHTLSAASAEEQKPPRVEEIVGAVGDRCLVELVDVDGMLHVLVVHSGRVRRRVAGRAEDVAALLAPAQMLLRRASRGRASDMTTLGSQLQQAILGDAVRLIPDGPVVLTPTARLHGLPWAILPALTDRPFSVVPSAGQWLRARDRRRSSRDRRRTLLVAGPGLDTGGAEVPLLASAHPDAVLLDGSDATLEAVMAGLDGADLVHLAAHGHFRADSPLFSSLDLADGPLTVHDLERVRRAPYRVVLSACESGVLAPVGSEELLGLAAALFSLGSAGLVCSVAEVNDAATADLMVALHAGLAAGRTPAEALLDVRRAVVGDPVAAGTAAAFLALGV